MIIDLPDTTTTQVNKQLVDLREKHGAVALGRVLTLVLVTVEEHSEAAIAAANHASHEHPCRVIAVVAGRGRGESRLDGQIRVGGDAGASDVVLLHTYGELSDHPASVVMPLLLPDAPVVVWWPSQAPAAPATDPVGQLAQRRITDSAQTRHPDQSLERARTGYHPGDTDLAWSRITLWRAVLAAALDQEEDQRVLSATVVGGGESPSADLLAAWLVTALDCPIRRVKPAETDGLIGVSLHLNRGLIVLDRAPDEDVALLSTPDRPSQIVALQHRLDRECLAEELRRLDPDEVYGEVLTEGLPRHRAMSRSGKGRGAGKKSATKKAATKKATGARKTATTKAAARKSASKTASKTASKSASRNAATRKSATKTATKSATRKTATRKAPSTKAAGAQKAAGTRSATTAKRAR